MQLVDANVILRYILWDHESLAEQAQAIIEREEVEIPFEVVSEVVYVLESVYETGRADIQASVAGLLNYLNIRVSEPDVLSEGLRLFATTRLDFVDALLVGYHRIRQAKVFSFDKKVNALVRQ